MLPEAPIEEESKKQLPAIAITTNVTGTTVSNASNTPLPSPMQPHQVSISAANLFFAFRFPIHFTKNSIVAILFEC
jgi:hypothetical protein